ncbi:hypothetical protein Q7O56_24545 [Pseudomonas protegens]|uniref:hypothetical protein n=1 Tax=Pseudomonas protegens TaxID=380021 RepID=UPI002770FC31|nr:hypothetical protein [Pseudomonas protegens]MDP9512205.1 hypothetical protein [Pseudomonas protegens]
MLRCTLLALALLAFSASADDVGQYSNQQELKIKVLNGLQSKYSGTQEEIQLSVYGDDLRESRVITDAVVTERLDRDPDMVRRIQGADYGVMSEGGKSGHPFKGKNGVTDQTVPGKTGAEEAEKLGVIIPQEVEVERIEQSSDCKGELNDGLQIRLISKCFTSLSNTALKITPYVSIDKTYTRGLSSLSSLVTTSDIHRCDVSVVRSGLWVTAKHCLDDVKWNLDILRVVVENKKVKIIKAIAASCKRQPCDIAYLYAETPKAAEIPTILSKDVEIRWDNPIFIPGIPYGANLAGIFKPESPYSNEPVSAGHAKLRYNDLVMWSPYNQGFCMSLTKDNSDCIIHTCSTVRGFSGAPIYRYDQEKNKIILVGIHSGSDGELNKCEVKSNRVNYAKLITFEDLPE